MDNLAILLALAEIRDIQDFRLREFMSELALDERQPATFYRELLKESRAAIRLIGDLQNRLHFSEDEMCELETDWSTQQQQIADLKTKMSSQENENRQRIEELESENQVHEFIDRVCLHTRKQLEPHAQQVNYIAYGGPRQTVLLLQKRCPFLQSFEGRVLALLDVPSLRQRVLEKTVGRIWSSCIIDWQEE